MSKSIYNNKVLENQVQENTMLNVTTQKNNFDRFSIQSAYSKMLIDIIKNIGNGRWDPVARYWTLPTVSYEEFVNQLNDKNFNHIVLADSINETSTIYPSKVTIVYDPEYKCTVMRKLWELKNNDASWDDFPGVKRNIVLIKINSFIKSFSSFMKEFKLFDDKVKYDAEYKCLICFEDISQKDYYIKLKKWLESNNVLCLETKYFVNPIGSIKQMIDYMKRDNDSLENCEKSKINEMCKKRKLKFEAN